MVFGFSSHIYVKQTSYKYRVKSIESVLLKAVPVPRYFLGSVTGTGTAVLLNSNAATSAHGLKKS